MAQRVEPLVNPMGDVSNPYGGIDPTTVNFPDKVSPLESAYHQTMDLDPERSGQVVGLTTKLNQPPAFVDANLDAAKKASAIPPSQYFADISKKYPMTADYLSEPKNMAVAKDDIDNMTAFEGAAKQAIQSAAQFTPGLFEKGLAEKTPALMNALDRNWQAEKAALKAGQLQEQLHFLGYSEITGGQEDSGTFTGQLWNRLSGLGAGQDIGQRISAIQEQLKQLEAYRPAVKGPVSALERGIYGATEFVPWITGSATRGAEFALGGAAVGGLASGGAGVGPGAEIGFKVGEAEYNFRRMAGMTRIMLDQVKDENGQPLPENIKNIASLVAGAGGAGLGMVRLGAVLKTIPGGEDFLKGFIAKAPDALLNPVTYKSSLLDYAKQWLFSTTQAAGSMGALTAMNIGIQRGAEEVSGQKFQPFSLRQAISEVSSATGEGAITFGVLGAPGTMLGLYSKMGDIARESKLAQRMPEMHQEFSNEVTKGTPIQTVYADPEKFVTYFQDKKLDPMGIAKELGVGDQLQLALDSGTPLAVPYPTWMSKLVGTGHYEGLKDDISFDPNELTANQTKERSETLRTQMDQEVAQATKVNPGWAEGRQNVLDQMKSQLQATGVYSDKTANAQAELAAKVIERMAARYGSSDPAEWLKANPIRIVNGQMEAQEPAAYSAEIYVENRQTFDRWKELLATGIKTPTEEGDEFKQLPLWMKNKTGRSIDEIAQEATESGLLKPGEDIFEKLRSVRKPEKLLEQAAFHGTPHNGDISDPRGFIQFTPKETLINLVKGKADESTFPHELAHLWLKDFHGFIQSGQGTEQHQADWGTLSKWLKIGADQKELTTDQQETFAKGFEQYLREGKSPSDDLLGVFGKFRRWLTRLYSDPAVLGAPINPEIRDVMDRMLASDDEISFAERNAGRNVDQEISIPGLDPALKGRLEKLRDQAHEEAIKQLMKPQMQEISEDHKDFLAKQRSAAEEKAAETLKDNPELTAMDSIRAMFHKDPKTVAASFIDKTMKAGDEDAFDAEAQKQGFSGADEMAKKIMDTPDRGTQIKRMADQDMTRYAGLRNRNAIKEEAINAVHNEKQADLMALEESIFRQKVAEAQGRKFNQEQGARIARLETKLAQQRAIETIASKPVSDAGQFMPYFTAERNAALKVQKSLQAGDWEEAANAKRQQLLNHSLVREAYAAKNEIAKTMNFFDRFASRKLDLKDIPYGFIRQIDTLLSDRGLAPQRTEDAQTYLKIAQDMAANGADAEDIAHSTGYMPDGKNGWKPEGLSDTVGRIQNDYRNLNIPDSILTARPQDYRSMSMADFRDLKQTVQAINAVGRGYDKFLDETIKMDRKEAAAKFRMDVESNLGKKYREERLPGSKPGETVLSRAADALNKARGILTPNLANLYSFCMLLSHGDKDGLAMNLIYRPLEHAMNDELSRKSETMKDFKGIVKSNWTEKEYASLKNDKVYIRSLDRDFTKDQLQAFANNWGTQTGRDRATNLIDGTKLTDRQTQEILSKITKKNWDFAQAQWDLHEKFWPDIVKLQQKVAGETPPRVERAPVETPWGTYPGGYYHLEYDRSKSSEAIKPVDERNAIYKTQGPVQAYTSHGFTKGRVNVYKQPLNLDTTVEFSHLNNLMHDLSHRQAIIDVNGFLRQKDTREAIINAIGREGYDTIQQHVKWVGADQGEYMNGLADKLLQRLRFGGTVASLGMRPATAPIFMGSNIINAVHDLGPINFVHSMWDFLSDRNANVQKIDSMIPAMAHRSTFMERDLNDMDQSLRGNDRLLAHLMFYPHQKADQAITYPVALHTYKQALLNGFSDQKARDMAYEAVTSMAGDGSVLNQSMIQRGSETARIFSWWYSWSGSQFNRLWRDGKMAGLAYDKGNTGAALMLLGGSFLYGVGFQGANEAFWKDMVFHNSQNVDEDKKKMRMAMRIPEQLLSYIPVIGPVGIYGLNKVVGSHADLNLPPVQMLETATEPLWQWAREKYTGRDSPHFWEDTAKSAAIIARYPQWFNTLTFNFLDSLNGMGDLSWRDLFTRRTKS